MTAFSFFSLGFRCSSISQYIARSPLTLSSFDNSSTFRCDLCLPLIALAILGALQHARTRLEENEKSSEEKAPKQFYSFQALSFVLIDCFSFLRTIQMATESYQTEAVEKLVDKSDGKVEQIAGQQKLSRISSENEVQKNHESEPLGIVFNTNLARDNRSQQVTQIGYRRSFGDFY